MRIDFYQLSRDPVEQVVALLARKVIQADERLLVISGELEQHQAISDALWAQGGATFLAHGLAGGPHQERQPILLSDGCAAPNEARIAIVADGQWREETGRFDRVLLLFGPEHTEAARGLWRELGTDEARELHIFKQGEDGAWREGR